MIIQRHRGSLLLITQPDHAVLSADIMRRWHDGGLLSHPRRGSLLLAIREHDNGWQEVDVRPLLDPASGELLDFMTAPDDVRRAVWPRGVERVSADPWAAALIAQHAVHVYRRYRGDAAWDRFFSDLEALRDRHLRRVPELTYDELLADYFFVRMGDLLSLTFCNNWREAPEQPGYAIRLEDARVAVEPDPFAGAALHLSVRAREVPDGRFETEEDAARAFAAAPNVTVPAIFTGALT